MDGELNEDGMPMSRITRLGSAGGSLTNIGLSGKPLTNVGLHDKPLTNTGLCKAPDPHGLMRSTQSKFPCQAMGAGKAGRRCGKCDCHPRRGHQVLQKMSSYPWLLNTIMVFYFLVHPQRP